MNFADFWRENRQDYQALLFDIDGTLSVGSQVMSGAAELLAELRSSGFPYYVLTNDGSHSAEEKSAILASGGLHVPPEEIIACGAALKALAEEQGWAGKRFFVLGNMGEPSFVRQAGLEPCSNEAEIESCFGIINGEGVYDWHSHIQCAINFFRRHPERPFVVPNPDSFWPGKPGQMVVGAGGQARFICGILSEMGFPVQPVYLGKPYRPIYDYAVNCLRQRFPEAGEFRYDRIMMVGDSLKSDIRGANRCGMVSALVLTGITNAEQAATADEECRPRLIFDTLG